MQHKKTGPFDFASRIKTNVVFQKHTRFVSSDCKPQLFKRHIVKGSERGQAIATTISPGEEDGLCRTTDLVR
jgi:hypothetical protein